MTDSLRLVVVGTFRRGELLTIDQPPEQPGKAHRRVLDPRFRPAVVVDGRVEKRHPSVVISAVLHRFRIPAFRDPEREHLILPANPVKRSDMRNSRMESVLCPRISRPFEGWRDRRGQVLHD